MAILAVVFVVSLCFSLSKFLDKRRGSQTYQEALDIATAGASEPTVTTGNTSAETAPAPTQAQTQTVWVPAPVADDPVLEDMKQIDLEALWKVNPQVVGWLRIPDTHIDYPIVQGEDNDFYLNHDWKGGKNSVGSIFMDHLYSPEL